MSNIPMVAVQVVNPSEAMVVSVDTIVAQAINPPEAIVVSVDNVAVQAINSSEALVVSVDDITKPDETVKNVNIHGIDFSKLVLQPQDVDLVIYHGRCSDGFGAALASHVFFKENGGINANGNKVQYFAASFNRPPPPVAGLNVLICDFSYKKDTMLKLVAEAKTLAIIDHHKSAEEDLASIPDENKVFRMDHSGAYLTWAYFYPESPMPLLIKYIEDNDIWIKTMPNTRELTSYIYSLPFEFEEYEKLLDEKVLMGDILQVAIGMQRQNDLYIKDAVGFTTMKFTQIDGMYFFVACINTSVLKSDIGNQIFTKFENANFSCCYSLGDEYGTAYVSLRSMNDRTDVSKIAVKYGGGGHRNASGCSLHYSHDVGNVLDTHTMYNMLNNIYVRESSQLGGNVVYLNSTQCRKQIGKYLLQTRYYDEGLAENVQECCSVLRNKLKDTSFHVDCKFSCVWSYDGQQDATWFSLQWSSKVDIDSLKGLLKDENNFQYIHDDKRIIFARKGCVNCL